MSILLPLHIGQHIARYPILQGAMAVRISGARLAGAVANAGGIGLIASLGIGLNSPYFGKRQFFAANQLALMDELQLARQISPDGIIGVNVIVATRDYLAMARTAAAHGANLIVTAAGLPLDLPEYMEDYPDVALVPIVANLQAAQTLCETWQQRYQRLPDALILENCKAIGGHFASQCQESDTDTLETAIAQLQNYLTRHFRTRIPLIVSGGIWDRGDIDRAIAIGADGVQIGTRFITTEECEADRRYKEFHLQAQARNVVVVPSPVGKPARAIQNQFAENVLAGSPNLEKRCIANCLESCMCRDRGESYCLIQALARAAQGDIEQGLVFSSGAIKPVEQILPVSELMASLTDRSAQQKLNDFFRTPAMR
ncbi:Nitronate monooxygenase domain-containing protein [Tumidithrix helvetica PCC 7403]|uniref:NAD(P)H-dependent flavin oxidoreductase n=1 Tax=Tumidithrix helvetica TaxID=3457545 RepID=UPI003CB160D0